MPAFEKLADHLVAEVPITKLQSLFGQGLTPVAGGSFPPGGSICGLGCNPGAGALCGFGCNPPLAAQDVIDPDGHLGITEKDLADIRSDLPKLRQAVISQLEAQLGELR